MLRRVFVILVAGPTVLLIGLYGLSHLIAIEFGDIIFAVTFLLVAGWILTTGSRRQTMGPAATSRLGALFGMDNEYARQMSQGSLRQYSDPSVLLVMLTVAVILGWSSIILLWVV